MVGGVAQEGDRAVGRDLVDAVGRRVGEVDRARGVYGWPSPQEGGLVIRRPESIAWDKLSQKKFNEVSRNFFQVAYDITGLDFTDWKEGRYKDFLRDTAA
jgi:hypothetical protein